MKNHISCNFSLHTRANVLCATFYVLYIQFTPFHFRRIVKHIFENLSLNLGPHLNHKFQPINYTKNLSHINCGFCKATTKLFFNKFSPLSIECERIFYRFIPWYESVRCVELTHHKPSSLVVKFHVTINHLSKFWHIFTILPTLFVQIFLFLNIYPIPEIREIVWNHWINR